MISENKFNHYLAQRPLTPKRHTANTICCSLLVSELVICVRGGIESWGQIVLPWQMMSVCLWNCSQTCKRPIEHREAWADSTRHSENHCSPTIMQFVPVTPDPVLNWSGEAHSHTHTLVYLHSWWGTDRMYDLAVYPDSYFPNYTTNPNPYHKITKKPLPNPEPPL